MEIEKQPLLSNKIIVGMMQKNNNLDLYITSKLMAYMARQFDIELYFFAPKDFNPEDNTINATLIDGNTRIQKIIPLPKIVYDVSGFLYKEEIKALFKDKCYFFQYGVAGTKAKMIDILLKDERLKEILVDTHSVKDFNQFVDLFEQYHKDVVLKPSSGSLGIGVSRIIYEAGNYVVILPEERILFKSLNRLRKYLEKTLANSTQVLQPYIDSRTKYGNPFDIRVHARRGAEGEFKFFPYPRLNRDSDEIISNISAGGHTMPIQQFLKQEYDNDWKMIYDKLLACSKDIVEVVQMNFRKTIFAMGIDFGIQYRSGTYELKLFEVNTLNPGIQAIPIEAAFVTLEYMQYLGKRFAEGKALDKV